MEILYETPTYPESILAMIRRSGSLGIAIANWCFAGGDRHNVGVQAGTTESVKVSLDGIHFFVESLIKRRTAAK